MKNVLKKIVVFGLVMFLSTTAIMATQIPIHAQEQDIPGEWEVTLYLNESSGRHDYVVFGESSDASDGQDDYDLIEPPLPPQIPYIAAWFDTDLDEPYNKLWIDYRQYPDDYEEWNLSVMWISESGSESSSTNIDISWNTSKIVESGYGSVLLCGDDVVADMLTENHYKFVSSSGLNRFQIICQSETVDKVDNSDTSFLYMILIFIIIISIIAISFVVYWKKKK